MAATATVTAAVTTTKASNDDRHAEESSPLLDKSLQEKDEKPASFAGNKNYTDFPSAKSPAKGSGEDLHHQWTADGLPLGHGSVVGEPMGRSQWNSSIFACLGHNDEFCSSDLEVCLLGSFAPFVLYGSNVERLGSNPGTFANHCLSYCGLCLIGRIIFRCNLAPCFSFTSRTAIRRKFNLEGGCEALNRSCGCCGSCLEDELQREQLESSCDFATHVFCHPCALCQEGREIRRRLPHPGYNAQPVLVMIPPGQQTMGGRA